MHTLLATGTPKLMRLPNKRLKLAGALKQGRIPFVRQVKTDNQTSVRCARRAGARSLSAIR